MANNTTLTELPGNRDCVGVITRSHLGGVRRGSQVLEEVGDCLDYNKVHGK